ncbi:hypothetical protein AHAS_Ahas13G0242400 [Arachis hypogaea]
MSSQILKLMNQAEYIFRLHTRAKYLLRRSLINPYFMIYFVLNLGDLFNPSLTYS